MLPKETYGSPDWKEAFIVSREHHPMFCSVLQYLLFSVSFIALAVI